MGQNKLIKHVPNILTITNMLLGLTAILFIIRLEHTYKPLIITALILLGGIADFFDGYIARKFSVVTDVGKQLDSFADIITFGVAPVAFVNYVAPCEYFGIVTISSLIFVGAGAYRLVRYNLGDFRDYFVGLPITAAGVLLTVYCAAYPKWCEHLPTAICVVVTALFILLLSVMMVSKKKFKRIKIRA